MRDKLDIKGKVYSYFSLKKAKEHGLNHIDQLPKSLKILLENLLRHEDGNIVHWEDIEAFDNWVHHQTSHHEISYHPSRVVMEDGAGVSILADLASMRDALSEAGTDPQKVNLLSDVDIIITKSDYENKEEEYSFLKWGQKTFTNFRVIPPKIERPNEIQIEKLSNVICNNELDVIYPDTCVGVKAYTSMVNGLGVLSWDVGVIDAEAAILGLSIPVVIPEVIGVRLLGQLQDGTSVASLNLYIAEKLRAHGPEDSFVEFFGNGMTTLSLTTRVALANTVSKTGALCGFFPIDKTNIDYLKTSRENQNECFLVEEYAKAQGIWFDEKEAEPKCTHIIEIDLSSIISRGMAKEVEIKLESCVTNADKPTDESWEKIQPSENKKHKLISENVTIEKENVEFYLENANILALISGKENIGHIYENSNTNAVEKVPFVIFAGKNYGTGNASDWAAKETKRQNVCAVIAESFDRSYRSNLINLGILPLQFQNMTGIDSLKLSGNETISLSSNGKLSHDMLIEMKIEREEGVFEIIDLLSCIETIDELKYFQNGGVLNYVARKINQS